MPLPQGDGWAPPKRLGLKGEQALNEEIARAVREFVIKNFLFEDDGSLSLETSFLDNGIIDSTGVLELISFLEGTYGIKIEDHEIVPENLDSLLGIAAFVERKLGAGSAPRLAAAN